VLSPTPESAQAPRRPHPCPITPPTAPQGALAIRTDQSDWSPAQQAAFAQLGIADAPYADKLVLLNQSQRTGLDPFTRQIYMIGRMAYNPQTRQKEMKYTLQTSIDGFRVVAQRSGEAVWGVARFESYASYKDEYSGKEKTGTAPCPVSGRRCPT